MQRVQFVSRAGVPPVDPDAREDSRPFVGAQVEWARNALPEGVRPPPDYGKAYESGRVELARGPKEVHGAVYGGAVACAVASVAAGYLAFKLLL